MRAAPSCPSCSTPSAPTRSRATAPSACRPACRACRAIYGVASSANAAQGGADGVTSRYDHEPARPGARPVEEELGHPRVPASRADRVRGRAQRVRPRAAAAARRTPPDSPRSRRRSSASRSSPTTCSGSRTSPPPRTRRCCAACASTPRRPLAIGEIFNTIWDYRELIEEQLIDYVRSPVTHAGGISRAPTHLRLRGRVPDQVGHARADRCLAGGPGRGHAPRARDPQLRHPGVHEALGDHRRGVPPDVHLRRRTPAPRRGVPGSASITMTQWRSAHPYAAGVPAGQPPARRLDARLVTGSPARTREGMPWANRSW